ncbi:sodium:solute symporter family transporter [Membranihabitans marinus]|uniref:sodium:solute symporter family transporter n=1 Tax=Membranihabitans marinus TaxID=1227546 RepID=UPI001EED5456|nr:sodium/solute symporter [Membranihabitans marinus]
MKRSILSLLILLISLSCVWSQSNTLSVKELSAIPDQEGFAGMFAGVSNGALLCMGGANFPEAKPWEGGEKKWYDNIYVLEDKEGQWTLVNESLPRPLAYGVAVNYQNEVIVIGGSNADGHYGDVFALQYVDGRISVDDNYPRLPIPLANMAGALVGDEIFVAGGLSSPTGRPEKVFYRLDLSKNQEELAWEKLEPWPGAARMLAVSASKDGLFYLFSGIDVTAADKASGGRTMLKDAYVFDPATAEWDTLSDLPRSVAAGPNPAPIMGQNHIIFAGGLDEATAAHTDPASHPGFKEEILAYNTLSKTYVKVGDMPSGGSRVTLPSTQWAGDWVIPNGESGPGVRSSKVYLLNNSVEFGVWNWSFLLVYLLGMLYMGYFFSKRGNTTEDYFLAGQRIPWWAAGLSIYGTQLSAITFMAIPAIVYATDWTLAIGSLMILAIVPLIIRYYVPFFRRLSVTTAYEYLEHRFNANVRTMASITFILMQLARVGIVVYLPAIAIASVTGLDIYFCIVIMGVISTIYTMMGGIEAVIWTDVIQVVVLIGGAICCIIIASLHIDGGFTEIIHQGINFDKFSMIHLGWDPSKLVLWVALVSFFFLNIIPYTSDQTVVQRYLTVKSEKEVAKSLWTNGLLMLPGIVIFFGLGTTLFVYYIDNPSIINSNKPDELLPFYIVHHLPNGLAGIVIAALFAASMSSLDSSMNSISSAYVTDIHPKIAGALSDAQNLRLAKSITIFIGVIGTASAMLIAIADVDYIFDFFQEMLGLFGGGLAGVFALAIFVKRANATSAIIGLLGSAMVTYLFKTQTDITGYLYGAIGVISCVLIGILLSFIIPTKTTASVATASE